MTTWSTTLVALVALTLGVGSPALVHGESGYEEPPVLKASDLAPAGMLKGPRFTVDERVPVVDLLGHFTLRSDFGVFEAHRRDMLGVRVIEVGALDQIEKTSKTGEFLKAAGAAAARPVRAGANIVLHPVKTVKGGPAAVVRFFDRLQLGAKHIACGTKGEGTTAEKTAAITQRVGGVTADVLGYEQKQDRARFIVSVAEMLARYHTAVEPLTQVAASGPIIARTRTGALLVPAPIDYVPWTKSVATFARRPDVYAKERTVWLADGDALAAGQTGVRGCRVDSARGCHASPLKVTRHN